MFTDSGNQDNAQSLCWALSGIRFLCELFIKQRRRRRRSPVPDIDSQTYNNAMEWNQNSSKDGRWFPRKSLLGLVLSGGALLCKGRLLALPSMNMQTYKTFPYDNCLLVQEWIVMLCASHWGRLCPQHINRRRRKTVDSSTSSLLLLTKMQLKVIPLSSFL